MHEIINWYLCAFSFKFVFWLRKQPEWERQREVTSSLLLLLFLFSFSFSFSHFCFPKVYSSFLFPDLILSPFVLFFYFLLYSGHLCMVIFLIFLIEIGGMYKPNFFKKKKKNCLSFMIFSFSLIKSMLKLFSE